MKIVDTRPQVIRMTALILFVVILMATILVPLMVTQSQYFTYIGLFNSALYGLIYIIVCRFRPARWHVLLVVVACFITLVPLVMISGGVNSQFIVLFPMIPIPLTLMSNSRFSWAVSCFMLVLIFLMLLFKDYLPDLTQEIVSEHKSRSRAIWVSLAIIISATFVMYFERANRMLRHKLITQAFVDELTAIPNRRSIMQLLQTKLQAADKETLAILMIDVDFFKRFNDQYGHINGDECLRGVAQSINQSIRSDIDAVGRYGGEEFLVVLDNVDTDNALQIAEKIRANIAQLTITLMSGETAKVTATIGISNVLVSQSAGVEAFLQEADQALYAGKVQGRNRVVVYANEESRTVLSVSC